ncbi:MAG TPA: DUF4199 domain-containing protein, partial [Bacteroidia bacterium]|nr:DUF4199 domain-containing protein [Bacteroidia bacterium]
QKKENKGFIPFKAALRTGVVYAIIVALGLAIFNFIYYKYIAPDAIEYYVSEAKNQIVEAMKNRPTDKQLTAEDIRRFEEHIRSLFGSFTMFGTTFLEGLIISLIVAGILQKKEPKMPFSEN